MPNWGRSRHDRDAIDQPLERTWELLASKPQSEVDLQRAKWNTPETEIPNQPTEGIHVGLVSEKE